MINYENVFQYYHNIILSINQWHNIIITRPIITMRSNIITTSYQWLYHAWFLYDKQTKFLHFFLKPWFTNLRMLNFHILLGISFECGLSH
jgi:hypothetical protein